MIVTVNLNDVRVLPELLLPDNDIHEGLEGSRSVRHRSHQGISEIMPAAADRHDPYRDWVMVTVCLATALDPNNLPIGEQPLPPMV